jgi:3-keto-disaccharide hydrolase
MHSMKQNQMYSSQEFHLPFLLATIVTTVLVSKSDCFAADNSDKDMEATRHNLQIQEAPPNTLTDAEKAGGWKLLWDGKTTAGWRSAKSDHFPEKGWKIEDGVWSVPEAGGSESAAAGDIITTARYSNFELYVEFKIAPGANSGIKYFVQPELDPVTGTGEKAARGSAIGLEFQILDDARHPDAKLGRDGDRTLGSLYDLKAAAATKQPNPIGEWNAARIVSKGKHVEHWLNGQRVLEYERGSPEFRALVAQSKFKNIPGFGEWADGHILLQDHGNAVSFRNIKLRVLQED